MSDICLSASSLPISPISKSCLIRSMLCCALVRLCLLSAALPCTIYVGSVSAPMDTLPFVASSICRCMSATFASAFTLASTVMALPISFCAAANCACSFSTWVFGSSFLSSLMVVFFGVSLVGGAVGVSAVIKLRAVFSRVVSCFCVSPICRFTDSISLSTLLICVFPETFVPLYLSAPTLVNLHCPSLPTLP